MDITFSSNPIKDWISSNDWKTMDATAKGFFAQLILIASQNKPIGSITSDENTWRQWLGIPFQTFEDNDLSSFDPKNTIQNELKKYFDKNNKNANISSGMLIALESIWSEENNYKDIRNVRMFYDAWINHLWDSRWKPMILSAMIKIDVDLVNQFPELNEQIGNYFIPLSYGLSNINKISEKTLSQKVETKTRKTRKKNNLPNIFETEVFQNININDISHDGLLWLDYNTEKFKDISKILKLWLKPISVEKRKTMWDIGVSLLTNDISERGKASALINKLIKTYGEEKTSKAIFELSKKPILPNDVYGYMISMIKSYNEGTIEEQKARAKRTNVSL